MFRRLSLAVFALMLAAPLAAQAPSNLMLRVDRSTNPEDPDDREDVVIAAVQNGFRVTTGPAAVIYNPANTATGQYTLSATFTLEQESAPQANGNPHNNYYGLVFGGNSLDQANQNYVYFIIAPNGMFQIKHRARDSMSRQDDREAIHTVQAATEHAAIRRPQNGQPAVNDLEVRVGASEIQYVVNGTVVHTTPKSGMTAQTDGIYGVRINHVLPSTVVTNLRMTPGN